MTKHIRVQGRIRITDPSDMAMLRGLLSRQRRVGGGEGRQGPIRARNLHSLSRSGGFAGGRVAREGIRGKDT